MILLNINVLLIWIKNDYFIDIYQYLFVGITFILYLLLLLCILVGYIIYVMNKVIGKIHTPRNSNLDAVVNYIQFDSDDNSEDDN